MLQVLERWVLNMDCKDCLVAYECFILFSDINECSLDPCDAGFICMNSPGSYQCQGRLIQKQYAQPTKAI